MKQSSQYGVDTYTNRVATQNMMATRAFSQRQQPMLVFDLDGTLLDSYEMSIEGHRQLVQALGLPPVSKDVLVALNGPTARQACDILGLPAAREAEFIAHQQRIDDALLPTHAKLFDGVPQMLKALSGKAILCLLTNGLAHYMRVTSRLTCIDNFFVESAAYVPGVSKAARLSSWMQLHRPCRVLMVGDRASDVEAAHQAGAKALGVTYGNGTVQELEAADGLADTVKQVLAYCEHFVEE